jgi:hypothetical protein
MSERFETCLSPADEEEFQRWKSSFAPDDSGADYDLRGAFKAGLAPDAHGHWPDLFKKPNHPAFSHESVYARLASERAGHWEGERFIPPISVTELAPCRCGCGRMVAKGKRGDQERRFYSPACRVQFHTRARLLGEGLIRDGVFTIESALAYLARRGYLKVGASAPSSPPCTAPTAPPAAANDSGEGEAAA